MFILAQKMLGYWTMHFLCVFTFIYVFAFFGFIFILCGIGVVCVSDSIIYMEATAIRQQNFHFGHFFIYTFLFITFECKLQSSNGRWLWKVEQKRTSDIVLKYLLCFSICCKIAIENQF